MKRVVLLAFLSPFFCNASELVNAEYSITTLYKGRIDKNAITMSLTDFNRTISGNYIYDKFGKIILLNGTSGAEEMVLNEKVADSTATITLKPVVNGYKGQWCSKKCLPVTLLTNNSFKNGMLKDIKTYDVGNGKYELKLTLGDKIENIEISESIDTPVIDFTDINNDGFYDMIVRTDRRPNNGSQTVYISSDKGFIEDKLLSSVQGTLIYKPYTRNIIFYSKDDCCEQYNKIIYSFSSGKFIKEDDLSFNYTNGRGKSKSGANISKNIFEMY